MYYEQKVIVIKSLQSIIEEFRQSTPQSEAEIRSKLIVPLLDYLGYPSSLRAEEFPVYGFEGRKKLPTKEADFVLFTDPDYANHRSSDNNSIKWVQDHSLLVAEAKKTGEMPGVLGQPQYYTVWTKAIAYFVTDGITFRGCFYKPITSDYEIVSCPVDELPQNKYLYHFSFDNLQETKRKHIHQNGKITNGVLEVKNGQLIESDMFSDAERIVFPDEEIPLPKDIITSMKQALGKNAEGIDDFSTVKKYLSMTDSYLDNDIRYNVPEYMINIPRKSRQATIHINDHIIPILNGEVTIYYQNEKERYEFSSDILSFHLCYQNDTLVYISAMYSCRNQDVDLRLQELETIKKIYQASTISIWIQDYDDKILKIHSKASKVLRKALSQVLYWIDEINKLKEIEKYYKIDFCLDPIDNPEDSFSLYHNVDIIYKGIKMQSNYLVDFDRTQLSEDVEFSKPCIIEDGLKLLDVGNLKIHNYVFIPDKVFLMPTRIKKKGKRIIRIDACVVFSFLSISKTNI